MTLLDELRPPRSESRLGGVRGWSWRQRAAAAVALLAVAGAVASLIYRQQYGPLEPGGGYGSPSNLLITNDGLQDTAYVVAVPGGPTAKLNISLRNSGRFDVRVDAVETTSEADFMRLRAVRMSSPAAPFDDTPLRFHPFVLPAGSQVMLQLEISSERCPLADEGGESWFSSIGVRYSFWHQHKSLQLPLPMRVVRACSQMLKPHVTATSSDQPGRADGLVDTAFGFAVPRGWRAGPVQMNSVFATTWSAVSGRGRVTYRQIESAGGRIYGREGSLFGLRGPATTEDVRAGLGCTVRTVTAVGSAFAYSCQAAAGMTWRGVIRPTEYDGYERIEIVTADGALAERFVRSIQP